MMEKLFHQYLGFISTPQLKLSYSFLPFVEFKFEDLSINNSLKRFNLKDRSVFGFLGNRAESFFLYYLSFSNRYSLINRNVQIFEDNRTIGEIDFLLLDYLINTTIHVEFCYKFYLYNPELDKGELGNWVGPNLNDSLKLKVDKFNNHQFPLLFKKQTIKSFEALGLSPGNIKQEVCLMTNLFLPINYDNINLEYINPKCIKGYWIRFEDLNNENFDSGLYNIPSKEDWFINPKCNNSWKCYTEIYDLVGEFMEVKKSPLCWRKLNKNTFESFFIVWW